MRKLFIMTLFLVFVAPFVALDAQTESSCGFNAGSKTQNNINIVLGQSFGSIAVQNGLEISEGVAQAQLVTANLADETCVNEPYTENGFDIPVSDLSEGTTAYDSYDHSATTGYDSLTILELTVWPVYAESTSEVFHDDLPLIDGSKLKDGVDYQVVEGENVIHYLSVHGCDSVVTLYVTTCPISVSDGDGNPYNTVAVAGYCWTQSNLHALHYADGTTPIAKSLVYGDLATNESLYGRLYTWYSAMGVPEDGSAMPTPDANGYVQGICPDGWHIPTSTEMAALRTQSAPGVRATTLWTGPHADENTNSTGFTAVPAGEYKSALERYENLGTQTDWWSDTYSHNTTTHTTSAVVITCAYYCEGLLENTYTAGDAVSVRCVKNS